MTPKQIQKYKELKAKGSKSQEFKSLDAKYKEHLRKQQSERTKKANKEARAEYEKTPKGKKEKRARRVAGVRRQAKVKPPSLTGAEAAEAGKKATKKALFSPRTRSKFRRAVRKTLGTPPVKGAKRVPLKRVGLGGVGAALYYATADETKEHRGMMRKGRRKKGKTAAKGSKGRSVQSVRGGKTKLYRSRAELLRAAGKTPKTKPKPKKAKPKSKSASGYGWSSHMGASKPKTKPKLKPKKPKPKAKSASGYGWSARMGASKPKPKPKPKPPAKKSKPKPKAKSASGYGWSARMGASKPKPKPKPKPPAKKSKPKPKAKSAIGRYKPLRRYRGYGWSSRMKPKKPKAKAAGGYGWSAHVKAKKPKKKVTDTAPKRKVPSYTPMRSTQYKKAAVAPKTAPKVVSKKVKPKAVPKQAVGSAPKHAITGKPLTAFERKFAQERSKRLASKGGETFKFKGKSYTSYRKGERPKVVKKVRMKKGKK